jgi:hypothetical protein
VYTCVFHRGCKPTAVATRILMKYSFISFSSSFSFSSSSLGGTGQPTSRRRSTTQYFFSLGSLASMGTFDHDEYQFKIMVLVGGPFKINKQIQSIKNNDIK